MALTTTMKHLKQPPLHNYQQVSAIMVNHLLLEAQKDELVTKLPKVNLPYPHCKEQTRLMLAMRHALSQQ